MAQYDVVVIGGGAAGLSGALVLARARRRVLVVDSGTPRNAPAEHMHGFLSRDGMPPSELLGVGHDEVASYGGEFVADEVQMAVAGERGFGVVLANEGLVAGRRLLVATGLRDLIPDIPGLRQRWGRDVLHCPYCHGWEVRDQRLAVLADDSPESIRYAQIVRQWSKDVVVVAPDEVARVLVEANQLSGLELCDGRVVHRDAVFVPPKFVPNSDLLVSLGCQTDDDGWVIADTSGRTTVSGVWVAGNVHNPRAQVITAAGEGSAAAIAINADLVDEDVRRAANQGGPYVA